MSITFGAALIKLACCNRALEEKNRIRLGFTLLATDLLLSIAAIIIFTNVNIQARYSLSNGTIHLAKIFTLTQGLSFIAVTILGILNERNAAQ